MTKEITTIHQEPTNEKIRVCAYARVSTSSDEQYTSYISQITYYQKLISKNPNYIFSGVFADEGKSGTNTKHRTEFNKMISLAKQGLIDKILTKSLSRFARNTVDCLSIINDLKLHNVEVFFEKENISSLDPNIEVVMSLYSGVAEEESRSISENVKWGIKKRFEKGIHHMNTSVILGYTKDSEGNVIIDEKQAIIARTIYDLYINGLGTRKIKEHLESQGYLTAKGNTTWNKSTIMSILKNEKYIGDALLQKTFKPTYHSEKRLINNGQVPQYYVENSHPAIISKAQFKQVQEIRNTRKKEYAPNNDIYKKAEKSIYTSFVRCPHCGKFYQMKTRTYYKTGEVTKFLQCASNSVKKTCPGKNIKVSDLEVLLLEKINHIIKNKQQFLDKLRFGLHDYAEYQEAKDGIIKLDSQVAHIKTLSRDLEGKEDEFSKSLYDEYSNQLTDQYMKLAQLQNTFAFEYNVDAYLANTKNILNRHSKPIDSFELFPLKQFFNELIIDNGEIILIFLLNDKIEFHY
jgi:DNA invertase Pin-like site-specific DNA recombinase